MNRQQAINAHCRDCIYDIAEAGSWRLQVENCTLDDCNLHEHRPLTSATQLLVKAERVANMSAEDRLKYETKANATRDRFSSKTNMPVGENGA